MTTETIEGAIVKRTSGELAAHLSPDAVVAQVQLIQQVMAKTMKEGEHFGRIPGCGDKPALFKAGAEKLSLTFRLAPQFKVEVIDLGHGHREYRVVCTITHITSGDVLAEGVGSCSTMEAKYRYRNGERTCPHCGKTTIIKGKAEYGGGYLCFAKKGGCGAKFAENDAAITGQVIGRVENPDVADCYNTCLKMAKKRAQVDATLTATAASDIFTQDIEENAEHTEPVQPTPAKREPQPTPAAPPPRTVAHDDAQAPAEQVADPLADDDFFREQLDASFAQRGFSPEAADGATLAFCKRRAVPGLKLADQMHNMTVAQRKDILTAVDEGKADHFKLAALPKKGN